MPRSFNFKNIKWVNQRINDLKDWNDWKVISLSHAFYCTQTDRICKILLPLFTTCHATVALYTISYVIKLLFHTYIFWLFLWKHSNLKGPYFSFSLFQICHLKKKNCRGSWEWLGSECFRWIELKAENLDFRLYFTLHRDDVKNIWHLYNMATAGQGCHSASLCRDSR